MSVIRGETTTASPAADEILFISAMDTPPPPELHLLAVIHRDISAAPNRRRPDGDYHATPASTCFNTCRSIRTALRDQPARADRLRCGPSGWLLWRRSSLLRPTRRRRRLVRSRPLSLVHYRLRLLQPSDKIARLNKDIEHDRTLILPQPHTIMF